MKYSVIILVWIFTSLIFYSCSSSEKIHVEENKPDSLYIFDEIPPEDIFKIEAPAQQSFDVYVIQIGAFSNLERAKEFAEQSRAILNKNIKVEFNQLKNLYLVWIHPPFEDKKSAETFRSEIWNYKEFKDAWIITVESVK